MQLGYGQNTPAALLGKWVNQDFGYAMVIEFKDGQQGAFEGENFSYQLKNETTLVLLIDGVPTTYGYQLQGDQLTLNGGDLDAAISFKRAGSQTTLPTPSTTSTVPTPSTNPTPSTTPTLSTANAIHGRWKGNGEILEFRPDGKCIFKGTAMSYSLDNKQIMVQLEQQTIPVNYTLKDNELQLVVSDKTFNYYREGTEIPKSFSRNPAELVGKWCYMSNYMLNSNSGGGTGGSSAEECITLHANGQFEYYSESSMSTNTEGYWGGTNSQNSDSGSWWFDGEKIHYQSQRTGKSGSYVLEKRNHPKNRDPMIVLDGRSYVTQYQKAPW